MKMLWLYVTLLVLMSQMQLHLTTASTAGSACDISSLLVPVIAAYSEAELLAAVQSGSLALRRVRDQFQESYLLNFERLGCLSFALHTGGGLASEEIHPGLESAGSDIDVNVLVTITLAGVPEAVETQLFQPLLKHVLEEVLLHQTVTMLLLLEAELDPRQVDFTYVLQ